MRSPRPTAKSQPRAAHTVPMALATWSWSFPPVPMSPSATKRSAGVDAAGGAGETGGACGTDMQPATTASRTRATAPREGTRRPAAQGALAVVVRTPTALGVVDGVERPGDVHRLARAHRGEGDVGRRLDDDPDALVALQAAQDGVDGERRTGGGAGDVASALVAAEAAVAVGLRADREAVHHGRRRRPGEGQVAHPAVGAGVVDAGLAARAAAHDAEVGARAWQHLDVLVDGQRVDAGPGGLRLPERLLRRQGLAAVGLRPGAGRAAGFGGGGGMARAAGEEQEGKDGKEAHGPTSRGLAT